MLFVFSPIFVADRKIISRHGFVASLRWTWFILCNIKLTLQAWFSEFLREVLLFYEGALAEVPMSLF